MLDLLNNIKIGFVDYFKSFTPQDYIEGLFVYIKIIAIIIIAHLLVRICSKLVVSFFQRQSKSRIKMKEQKANTLMMLTKSVLRYGIYFLAGINIIAVMGFGVAAQSIIATAGVGGLAIGFGAQNLVKDVISGFFILLEDQYDVGDFVTIGETTGTVEDIELRITKVRGFKGDLNIIPNGQVSKVTNFSRGNSLAMIEMSIAYEVNIDKALQVMEETTISYSKDNPDIIEEPIVQGVVGFGSSEVNIRVVLRTLPMKHWQVERELRKIIKEAFDKNGIEIPYPRRVMIQHRESEEKL